MKMDKGTFGVSENKDSFHCWFMVNGKMKFLFLAYEEPIFLSWFGSWHRGLLNGATRSISFYKNGEKIDV